MNRVQEFYRFPLVLLSSIISIASSTLRTKILVCCSLGSVIAGLCITGIHAAPLSIAKAAPDEMNRASAWSHTELALWFVAGILFLLLFIPFRQLIDRRIVVKRTKSSLTKFQFIFEHNPDIVCLHDLNGQLLKANPAVATVTGYTPNELMNKPLIDFIDVRERFKILRKFKKVLRGQAQMFKFSIRDKKGDVLFFNTSIVPVIANGVMIGIYSVSKNITAQIKIEKELRKELEAAYQNEAALAEAQQIAQLGSWEWNPQTNAMSWSIGMYRLFGMPDSEVSPEINRFVSFIHPADQAEFRRLLVVSLQKAKECSFQCRIIREGGALRYCYGVIRSEVNQEGVPIRVYGFLQDITECKQREEEWRAEARSKSDFLAYMSHEIRTPANAIAGFGHLLLETELSEKQKEYVRKVQSASQTLIGIVSDILDFSKIEAGKLELESIPFQLDGVFKDVADVISLQAAQKGLDLFFISDWTVPDTLIGDPLRLRQVLMNLANNAIKFTKFGEIVVRSELLSMSSQYVNIKFSVADTGIGLTDEQKTEIFQAFT